MAQTGAHDVMHRRRLCGPIAIRRVTSLLYPVGVMSSPSPVIHRVEEGGGSYDTEADEDPVLDKLQNGGSIPSA